MDGQVLFDAYRHMDGWGRTVAMPAQLWSNALHKAFAAGVYVHGHLELKFDHLQFD